MRNWLIMIAVVLAASSIWAAPANRMPKPIIHPTVLVYSAGPGSSLGAFPQEMGLNGRAGDAITSAPGTLSIVPGERWSNFVTAAKEGVTYAVKSVVLEMITGEHVQCADWLPQRQVTQSGEANIRLWWPLTYAVPGDTWRLTILYGTIDLWDDDGVGPNLPSHIHTEIWEWRVVADVQSVKHLLAVFHQTPFGLSQVPLISDEALYVNLQHQVDMIQEAMDEETYPFVAGLMLGDLEMTVMDACIANSPSQPNPAGDGTGIANSLENSACCKLLVDCEYIGWKYGPGPDP